MNGHNTKWTGFMVAVLMAASVFLFVPFDDSDAAGDSEENPQVYWKFSIWAVADIAAVPDSELEEGQQSIEPNKLVISWGDGKADTYDIEGWGHYEKLHTYREVGKFKITATPLNEEANARYSPMVTYIQIMGYPTVTYHLGGHGEDIVQEVKNSQYNGGDADHNYYTKTTPVDSPTDPGYTFTGWYTDEEGTELFDWNSYIVRPVDLYAGWTEDPTVPFVTVTVDGTPANYIDGTKVAKIHKPSMEGYEFAGWFADSNYTIPVSDDTVLTDGMALFSKMIEVAVPTEITVTADGAVLTVPEGTTVSGLEHPDKEGFRFDGWYSDAELTIPVPGETVLTDGMELFGKYSEIGTPVTVKIDGRSVEVTAATVGELEKPVREGFRFDGWYSDAACTVAVSSETAVTQGMSLYAAFTQNPADTPSDNGKENNVIVPVAVCVAGILAILIGLRLHPVIMVAGIVIVAFGGCDLGGLISLF